MLNLSKSAPLPVVAKPGRAVDGIPFLDDATRPKAPPIPGATAAQRAQGRRLGLFHRHHLQELVAVRSVLNRFLSGAGTIEAVSDSIASMSMIENYRRFGNLCGSQCQMLQIHHDIEEGSIYPVLRRNAGLRPVLDRLSAEHRTVHALLERIQEASKAIAFDPNRERLQTLGEIYDVFERIVVSHFGYEERELEEALGYYNAI